jgi:hypothetical protein
MPSLVAIHPAGWKLTKPNNTYNNNFKSRLSILILSKT